MARIIEIKTSPEGNWCIKEIDFTVEEMSILHRIMENKFMESDDYNLRGPPCAFFQMGYGNESGPAMIEFFNPNKQDAQKFVDYVNNQLKG